jgi:PAT family beta-lactamase induction signal transducer AmpG
MEQKSISLEQQTEIGKPRFDRQSPWIFVPTLHFAEGVPYVIVNSLSIVMYKKLGVDNAQIAFWTSLLYLPWVIKMLWGPLVDVYSTKRNWILYTQLALAIALASLAVCLHWTHFFFPSLVVLAIVALLSATHDTAVDGFYLLSLDKEAQAFFVGIRSTFYRIAMLFGSGLLVFLAGQLEKTLDVSLSWTIAIAISAGLFMVLWGFHSWFLPVPLNDSLRTNSPSLLHFYRSAVNTYFNQSKIWVILAFIFLYRIGEAMLVKLAPPFLLDSVEAGGLELSTAQVGLVYGTMGALALTLGGVLGGWLVSRYGAQRSMIPMALALNLPHLFYIYLAYVQPPVIWIYPLVAIEQFGYGLGTAAYSVYFMYLAKDAYKTSHFAISTGFMALGMMLLD